MVTNEQKGDGFLSEETRPLSLPARVKEARRRMLEPNESIVDGILRLFEEEQTESPMWSNWPFLLVFSLSEKKETLSEAVGYYMIEDAHQRGLLAAPNNASLECKNKWNEWIVGLPDYGDEQLEELLQVFTAVRTENENTLAIAHWINSYTSVRSAVAPRLNYYSIRIAIKLIAGSLGRERFQEILEQLFDERENVLFPGWLDLRVLRQK